MPSDGPEAAIGEAVPTVKIDNYTDPFATILKIDFGDNLGELLDTVHPPR